MMKRKLTTAFCLFYSILVSLNAQAPYASRVLLIPLDDRPPCLQFPMKMGLIGDVELVTPPRHLLGRFTQFGKCGSIILWLKKKGEKVVVW